jgi:nucleoside-diphosphate-sugar epimerase
VLLFGLGMIGTAIRDALRNLDYHVLKDLPFDWQDVTIRSATFERIRRLLVDSPSAPHRLSFVWSAGRAGFHSGTDEVNRENETFRETLEFASKLREDRDYTVPADYHYISSAGGLFEGQRVIGPNSKPAPHRPYGYMKLAQEQDLKAIIRGQKLAIYRPSSVYGPMTQKSRQGLINNLVRNGRKGKVTTLDAHVMSLRDYVFAGDIGKFIAKRIRSNSCGDHFLVSARCSSIFEVVRKIERVLKLRLRVQYNENFGNNLNITFSEKVLPAGWCPTTLDIGIRQFLVLK